MEHDIDFEQACWAFNAYADRNDRVHCNIQKMKESGDFDNLKYCLKKGLDDLDGVFSHIQPEIDMDYLRRILQDEIVSPSVTV